MKLLRKILKGISLTAAMFVFQACYGEPQDWPEQEVNFRVLAAEDGSPLKGIKVSSQPQSESSSVEYGWRMLGYTDSNGFCSSYIWQPDDMDTKFRFFDKDSVYAVKDTIISKITGDTIDIVLTRI